MYQIKPSRVFVSDRVLNHEDAMPRLQRFLDATGTRDYEVVPDERIPWMMQQPEWTRLAGACGARPTVREPVFFFNTFRFDDRYDEVVKAIAKANPNVDPKLWAAWDRLGYRHLSWFNSGQTQWDVQPNPEHICRPCWRLNFSPGCVHQCLYCGLVGGMTVGLNIREYLSALEDVIAETPWQTTYLGDDASDLLILEPELGIMRDVCEFFGRQTDPDRYFILHTKSANVDFLSDVDHRGHLIPCWSLSGRTQSAELEADSGTMEQRIDAAAKCQSWGMAIRYKFKPFIPVRGWREEAREMIRMLFERTQPDNLSMTVLMWMSFEGLAQCVDLDRLDPVFVDKAREYAKVIPDDKRQTGPFPPEVRCEIYRFLLNEIRAIDADVPVTMSTESREVWKTLGPEFGVTPGEYVCGCGPCAVPGLKTLPQNAWTIAREHLPARIAALRDKEQAAAG